MQCMSNNPRNIHQNDVCALKLHQTRTLGGVLILYVTLVE